MHRGKPTALGLASGLVAGLVAVTPASGYVSPLSAMLIGVVAGVVCYWAVYSKAAFKHDDSLDAFGVHGVGGLIGALLTGVFASFALWLAVGNKPPMGVIEGEWPVGLGPQMLAQLAAAVVAAAYGFVGTVVLVKAIDLTMGFTLKEEEEGVGTDRSEHGEVGFDYGMGATIEEVPEARLPEPRPAMVPPNGKGRFTVILEGPSEKELMTAWSGLCQAGVAHPPEFKAVYPLVTTVNGNRFHLRGGDHFNARTHLQKLFESILNTTVHARVEE
jgi:hypothetical protein